MPSRRCCVCRSAGDKSELLRFVLGKNDDPAKGNASLTIDFLGVLPGRGAYCHLDLKCLGQKNAPERIKSALKANTKRGVGSKQDSAETIGGFLEFLNSYLQKFSAECPERLLGPFGELKLQLTAELKTRARVRDQRCFAGAAGIRRGKVRL